MFAPFELTPELLAWVKANLFLSGQYELGAVREAALNEATVLRLASKYLPYERDK